MENQVQTTNSSSAIIQPLYEERKWLKFLGVFHFVIGIIYCITIFGAIFGWIPIWIGNLLIKASKNLETGMEQNNEAEMLSATKNLGLTIKIIGILTLIGLIINVLVIGLYIIIFVLMVGLGVAGAAANS